MLIVRPDQTCSNRSLCRLPLMTIVAEARGRRYEHVNPTTYAVGTYVGITEQTVKRDDLFPDLMSGVNSWLINSKKERNDGF